MPIIEVYSKIDPESSRFLDPNIGGGEVPPTLLLFISDFKLITMKKITVILLLFVFIHCDVYEFTTPKLNTEFVPPKINTSIKALDQKVRQNENPFLRLQESEDTLWLEGYISSSDLGGNFYKEVYLQDAPENPDRAMRILLDQTGINNHFPLGRKLYIKLNGLGVGFHKGILTLGLYNADGLENLPPYLIEEHIIRSDQDFVIHPMTVEVSNFEEEKVGMRIRLEEVQFSDAERGRTFAAQAFDRFDGERRLLHCKIHHNVWLSTSTFSKFKSVTIPHKGGEFDRNSNQGLL